MIDGSAAVNATNNALGYAVGKLYAEKYFPAADKARVQQMVKNLIVAFGVRIDSLAWMDPATKKEAKAKLAVLKIGVGYPDKWPEYTGLKVAASDLYGNAERSDAYEYQRNLAKLDQPVDRSEWVMTPQTVNAVNLPALNAMNFPGGDPAVAVVRRQATGGDGLRRHRSRPSATRSATASTARARSSTRPASCATGGRRRTWRTSRHRRSSSLRSTMRTSPSPTWRSTARRR